jgi:hypothetical protein
MANFLAVVELADADLEQITGGKDTSGGSNKDGGQGGGGLGGTRTRSAFEDALRQSRAPQPSPRNPGLVIRRA